MSAHLITQKVTRCAALMLRDYGFVCLAEVRLKSGRRVDLMGTDRAGQIVIVEVKSGEADFRADNKWPEYLPYCDQFYFAVPMDFPRILLEPQGEGDPLGQAGLIIADEYGADITRPAPIYSLHARRRSKVHHLMARTGAQRWVADLASPSFG